MALILAICYDSIIYNNSLVFMMLWNFFFFSVKHYKDYSGQVK